MSETNIETRVAIVEKELGAVYNVFQRFDTTMEKLVDVSNSLKELLAVHDNRLMEREKADLTIFELMEKRKEEYSRGVERVYQKMDDISSELRREIRAEINEQYDDLKEAVTSFNNSMKEISDKLDKRIDNAISDRDERFKTLNVAIKEQHDRINSLERWRWILVGGGVTLGFIFGKWANIAALFAS